MTAIRHGQPQQHRVVRRGGWLVAHHERHQGPPPSPAPPPPMPGDLVGSLVAQGWDAAEQPPGDLAVTRHPSGLVERATNEQLWNCDIEHLSDPLEHDTRTHLQGEGLCP